MTKTILITGAGGYVGAKFYEDLKKTNNKIIGTYHNFKQFNDLIKVDLTNELEVKELFSKYNPEIIVHVAANGNGGWCEENPEEAYKLNVLSTKYIVNEAKKNNSKVILISTFACFNPTNVYGRTKKEAEELVETLDNYVILRPSLIMGLSPNTENDRPFNKFLKNFIEKSEGVYDLSWKFNVTYLRHLSEVLQEIINKKSINKMIIPVVAKGETTRFQMAKDILEPLGIKFMSEDKRTKIDDQEIDFGIYKKLGLPEYDYKEVVKEIKNELLSL